MALHSSPYVTINNEELTSFRSISIRQDMLTHHDFEISCRLDLFEDDEDQLLAKTSEFIGSNFVLQIRAASDEEGNFGEFEFRGLVTKVSNKHADTSQGNYVHIKGKSPTILMDNGPNCSTHLEKTIGDVADSIVQPYPGNELNFENDSTFTNQLDYIVQYNQSDWNFLRNLAIRYGQWLFYDGDKTYFGRIPGGNDPIELTYGFNLSEIDIDMNIQPTRYKFFSTDYASNTQESTTVQGSDSGLNGYNQTASDTSDRVFAEETVVMHGGNYEENMTQQCLDSLAQDQIKGIVGNMVFVHGVSQQLNLKLGAKVKFANAGINGNYFITAITHHIGGNGDYSNSFEAIPAEAIIPFYMDMNVHAKVENQTAIVVENIDQEGMGRVKVQFPWQKDTGDHSNWVRCARPSAGDQRGMYFMPEIDDEVLVTFEQGDIQRPIVIGSLWNGNNVGMINNPDNNKKSLRTRSGMHIDFYDRGGDESIIIGMGGSENRIGINFARDVIILNSMGEIKLKAEGDILIESQKQVKIKSNESTSIEALGDVQVESNSNIEQKSTGNFKAEGMNVSLEASMNLNAKAGMSAELEGGVNAKVSGSAMTEVKGGIVKIN